MLEIPGISVCIGDATPINPTLLSMSESSNLRQEPFIASSCCGFINHHATFYPSAVALNIHLGVGLVLDGWVVPNDHWCQESVLELLLEMYLAKGIGFVEQLNGAFNLLIWDNRDGSVFAANDRYGLRPWSHRKFNSNNYLSPHAHNIFQMCGDHPQLNQLTFYNLLSYSRIIAGQETMCAGIRSLPPATVLKFRNGSFTESSYWDYSFDHDEIDDSFIEAFTHTFRQVVNRQSRTWNSIGINLSGGLDSRVVAAAMDDDVRDRTCCFTWGYSQNCEEVRLARQTADTLGFPWRFIELHPEDFLRDAQLGTRVLEGQDASTQSYGLKVFNELSIACDVSVSGLAFDLLCGGSYSSEVVNANLGLNGEAEVDSFLDRFFYFGKYASEMYLDLQEAARNIEEIREQLRADLLVDPNAHPADLVDRFALRQRVWRYIFPRQMWQRLFVEDVAPTFDNDLVDLLLKIPPSSRANHNFYRSFMERLSPASLAIPYQRTLLPPSVPTKFWGEAARLESERELLLRRIYYETEGKVYVPYHRYYSNFDEWLRVHPAWLAAVDELLLSPKSRVCQRYVRQAWVRKLVDEQRSGRAAHYSRLVVLLTAEHILREYL